MLLDEKLQKKINWIPHKGQKEVLDRFNELTKHREMVICAGRRWGKSAICGYMIVRTFLQLLDEIKREKRDSVKIWIVAPTYELAKKVFSYVVNFLRAFDSRFDAYVTDRPNPQVKISDNIWIQCKSADTPRSLIGEELDLLVLDEAADISEALWWDRLAPCTSSKDRQGRTIFIGTPRGRNWFFKMWKIADDYKAAFHFTSLDGVQVDQTEWDRMQKLYPKGYFQQNYEATFLEEAYSVFRKIDRIIVPADINGMPPYDIEPPQMGHIYVGGLDLAKINDFTVLTIFDKSTHKQVYFDRFQKILFPLQYDRVEEALRKYHNARCVVELNAVGIAVADELKARGCNIQDFKTVGTISKDFTKRGSKEKIINKLATDIENINLKIANIPIQIKELEMYGQEETSRGNIRYAAPEGYHDDCVMSIALANWALRGKTKQENYRAARSMPRRNKPFEYK